MTNYDQLDLVADPAQALETIRQQSATQRVLVFKKSPICPTSSMAERELRLWLETVASGDDVTLAMTDVIAQKPLARGLTKELGIQHESPQALWFSGGELKAHDSHGALTTARFDAWKAGDF